jgi:light-regulated signal transduction histidine kinase (bacteriophytochrome)
LVVSATTVTFADARLLAVVLENLIGNAWKFTRKRAQSRIELGETSQDGCPTWFVRDNGAGFDMAYAEKLFVVFQRLHLVSEFEGTGIGLANVERIIRRHGGRVWAEGEVGRGATFFFTLEETK